LLEASAINFNNTVCSLWVLKNCTKKLISSISNQYKMEIMYIYLFF
jgi:hypothetical protein